MAVFVAGVFDGVDGRVARLTGTSSEFGVQYDSLADLISFGMAPSLVMYHWALVGMKLDGPVAGKIGWAAAFLYVACAALRLARFNTQVGVVDKRWFIGLNSPSSAGVMMSFVWAMNEFRLQRRLPALRRPRGDGGLRPADGQPPPLHQLQGWPEGRGGHDGDAKKGERVPFWVMLLVVGVLVALLIDTSRVLLVLATLYALSGPAYWAWTKLRRKPAS